MTRISLHPLAALARKAVRSATPSLEAGAVRSWEIAPAETVRVPAAHFLPGQLERIRGWEFSEKNPAREMSGGYDVTHAPTRAFLLRDAVLLDGVLYHRSAVSHVTRRTRRWPWSPIREEVARGALYATAAGNRYFGQWLMDDCVTYPLAVAEGTPITVEREPWPHMPQYEEWLTMRPTRCSAAHLREVVVFDDVGQNRSKRERFRGLHDKLAARVPGAEHAGVFILRGTGGQRRVMTNERAVAARLERTRGFRVVDPEALSLAELAAACAGARVVVGVEGSQLLHGLLLLQPGGTLMTLQPPNRFVAVLKHLTDRDARNYAFVVGIPDGDGFSIPPEEIERTLDLLPA